MNERMKRFTDLMRQIFELDKADLDFGIYRIMNIRKAEIERFLTEGLPEKVHDTLAPFAQGDQDEIKARMAQIEQALGDVSAIPDAVPMKAEYLQLQKQLAEGTDLAALETDVYSALYSFFNRYYEEGDFISKRRYKEGVYAIPYEGEEVKLYWANQDQYYIKTSENFKDYTFLVGDYTVHFRLVDATTEQNNNKEQADSKRVFMVFTEDEENYPGIRTFEYNDETKELIIRFVFDIPEDKKRKYFDENYAAIRSFVFDNHLPMWQELLAPIATGKGKETTDLLQKHLKGYVAKNTFDYFIHKDLRGFLSRELDFYIKSEIMHLDDLDTGNEARVETYLAKIRAVKRVGKIIIDFLAQIEDFQKKLWLKKKFVVETNWCMTLDRVDESFWPEIIANRAQIEEWIAMYAIDEVEPSIGVEGWTNPPSMEFLRQNQNLLIDTKHFSDDFKLRLTATIDRLDEKTQGVMVQSDNYHAMNMLYEKYNGKIDCCYYDPPYNTSEGTFLYKNGYKDSSWATMMADRIDITKELLSEHGVLATAIDDYELPLLEQVLDQRFGHDNRMGNLVIEIKPSGRTNDNYLATSHEYILFYGISPVTTDICFFPLRDDQLAQYSDEDENGAHKWRDFMRTGGYSTPEERPNSFYPIYYNETTQEISLEQKEGFVEILPVDTVGRYRVWRKTKPSFLEHLNAGEIRVGRKRGSREYKVQIIDRIKTGVRPKSVWVGSRYDASTHGTKWLKSMFGDHSPFSFPKSIFAVTDTLFSVVGDSNSAIILDVFAGSATTGEAVLRLNREADEDGELGTRKYVLVEMGDYFEVVTKPRMKKVVYAADWKDGKPQNRNTGVSQIIKYMRLESYEDALSNISLNDDVARGMVSLFDEEYLIHYMLDLESRDSLLDVEAFRDPFAYQMKITEKNECKTRPVDLVETFNYLIGLTVVHQSAVSYFAAKQSAEAAYEGAVDLVKDLGGEFAFRQIEGTLPDGRRALVIWRTVTDDVLKSNAALDAYFTKYRINPADREYDVIFVNGDSNLENLRTANESWKVQMTEIEFKRRMFEEA